MEKDEKCIACNETYPPKDMDKLFGWVGFRGKDGKRVDFVKIITFEDGSLNETNIRDWLRTISWALSLQTGGKSQNAFIDALIREDIIDRMSKEEWIKYLNKTGAKKVWLKNLEEGIYPKEEK